MGLNSFAQLQSEIHAAKKKQAEAVIRRVQQKQEANRRRFVINTDRSSMQRFVKTHYDK
jgi:hypothetical protein